MSKRTRDSVSKWTRESVVKLIENGITYTGDLFPKEKEKSKKTLPECELKLTPEGLRHIDLILFAKDIPFEKEKLFVPGRKFRADRYVPSLNLLIEYEGIYSETSRHTHFSGYSKDSEKYNYANALGYKLLRFTADNYKQFTFFLEMMIDGS